MTRGSHIFGWLDAVKIDGYLPASCFKVAYQLAQKTNGAEHEKSGALITWQSIPTMAGAIRMSERTVSDMVSRLQAAGHLAVETGRGRGHSNRYTLIQQNLQPAAVFNEDKTGSELPVLDQQNLQPDVLKPAVQRAKTCSRLQPNYSISNSITSTTTADTDAGGPRGLEGLGPLLDALRKRHGEAEVAAWLTKPGREVQIISQGDGMITLSAPSRLFAIEIRNRFGATIEQHTEQRLAFKVWQPAPQEPAR